MMRLAIVGMGRMARAIAEEASARGHEVAVRLGRAENPGGAGILPERFERVDAALEFTRPDAAVANLERLIGIGVPVVTGTTGWFEHLPRIEALVHERDGALLYAPNFSIGVQLFFRTARELARRLHGRPGFDAAIVEQHHRGKLDAPSGTALALQGLLRERDPGRDYPITSVRSGWVPGTHALEVDAAHETIVLTHTARHPAVFASGAVLAAEWLVGRRGVFTFEQALFGDEP
ncbi:MAG TPA: dihydrodipicolinate reductase C-terminal domain-containing protein [Gemmatimonadales bacterium]|jgi:4-hydroxy-tetrahydrodipicolinate reductase|nr:dihydrodipicolinate reductase C-terminal domain-containing protein [Gemmatimonadales bacterium]